MRVTRLATSTETKTAKEQRYLAWTRDDEDTDVGRTTWNFTTINLTSMRDITRGL